MNWKKLISLCTIIFLYGCSSILSTASISDYDRAIHSKAMASGTNGILGAAWGRKTVGLAIDDAISICTQNGGVDCKVVDINGFEASNYSGYRADERVVDIKQRTPNSDLTYKYRCADITKAFAYSLLANGHSYLDKDGDGSPCEYSKSYSSTNAKSNCHWVNGYTRKNGTYVRGHRRCR